MRIVQQSLVAVIVALSLAPVARRLDAQTALEVGPVAAYYAPTLGANDGPNAPGRFSGHAYGAEATLWLPRRLGVRAEMVFAGKRQDELANPGGWEPAMTGRVSVTSLTATYDLSTGRSHAFWVEAGPGMIRHEGDAFQGSPDPTSTAAIVGFGSTLPVGHALRFTFGASAAVYHFTAVYGMAGGPPPPWVTPGSPYTRRLQRDAVIHAAFTWNGR